MRDLVRFVSRRFRALADPVRAAQMAAYMKTDLPFYGVPKPQRLVVYRDLRDRYPITTRRAYREAVTALWARPHREERYTAIHLARSHPDFGAELRFDDRDAGTKEGGRKGALKRGIQCGTTTEGDRSCSEPGSRG